MPFTTARAKSGAGTWNAKSSQISPDLVLVVQRVDARDDTTRAVAEQVDGLPWFALFRQLDEHRDVADIVRQVIDIKPFAVRFSPAPQVERVDREARGLQLIGNP